MVESRYQHKQELSPEEKAVRQNSWQLGLELKAANNTGNDDHSLDKFTAHVQKLYGDPLHRDRADEVMRRFNNNHRSEIEAKFGHVKIAGVDTEGHVLTRDMDAKGKVVDGAGVDLRDGSGKKISQQLTMHDEERNGVAFKVGADGHGSYQLKQGEQPTYDKAREVIRNFYGKDGQVPSPAETNKILQGTHYDAKNKTIELPSLYRDVKQTDSNTPIDAAPGAHGRDQIANPDKQATIKLSNADVTLRDGSKIPSKTTSEYGADGKIKSENIKYGTDADQKSGHLPVFAIKRSDGSEQVFAKVTEMSRTKNGEGFDNVVKMANGQEMSFHTDGHMRHPQFNPPKLDEKGTDGSLLANPTNLRGVVAEGSTLRFGAEWTAKTDTDRRGNSVWTVKDADGNLRDQKVTYDSRRPGTVAFTDNQGRDISFDKVTEVRKIWNEARNGYDVNIVNDGTTSRFQTGRTGRDPEAVAAPTLPKVGETPHFDIRDRVGDGLHQPGTSSPRETVDKVSYVDNKFGWHSVDSTVQSGTPGKFEAKITTVLDQQNRLAERTVDYSGSENKPSWNWLGNVNKIHTVRNNDGTYTLTASAEGGGLMSYSGNWEAKMDLQGQIIKGSWKSLDK